VETAEFGLRPGRVQSVFLGQYKSNDSLSLSFLPPVRDGGLAITSYFIEVDRTSRFDTSSSTYRRIQLANIPEIQVIETTYRSGDDIKQRGGSFMVQIGGRRSVPLAFDISAFDLEIVINTLLKTRHVAISPVSVSREDWIRGYRWAVTFEGCSGNIGMMKVDSRMMLGEDVQMKVTEKVRGFGDIYPGQYTHEVQTITVSALSPVYGTFVLEMGGYKTEPIHHNEHQRSFRKKLEKIPTIFTVKVERSTVSAANALYSWTVTFTNIRKEVVQGAGNLPPFIVKENNLSPNTSAIIEIFELVKGTNPLQVDLIGLEQGVEENVRITAYNSRGYSTGSTFVSTTPLGQPLPPIRSSLSVISESALQVDWQMGDKSDNSIDGFLVEYYTSEPVEEVQVVTTSSSASLPEIQRVIVESDENNLAGYFTLEFEGESTNNILWNANAEGQNSLAQALARLSTVGAIEVSRRLSRIAVPGLQVNGTYGLNYVTVSAGSTSTLARGDIIWISDVQYAVSSVSATHINLESMFCYEFG